MDGFLFLDPEEDGFLGAAFLGSVFLGALVLGAAFLASDFLGSDFFGAAFFASDFLGGAAVFGADFLGSGFFGALVLGADFLGSGFLGALVLGAGFLGSAFLGSGFLGSDFLGGAAVLGAALGNGFFGGGGCLGGFGGWFGRGFFLGFGDGARFGWGARDTKKGRRVEALAGGVFDVDVDVGRAILDSGAAHQAHLLSCFDDVAHGEHGVDGAEVHVAHAMAVQEAADAFGLNHHARARRPQTHRKKVDLTITGDVGYPRQGAASALCGAGATVEGAVFGRVEVGEGDGGDLGAGHSAYGGAKPGV